MTPLKKYMSKIYCSLSQQCTISHFLGAFGYFEVTHDIMKYCKADVFSEIGKKTRVCVRFSTVGKKRKERGREGER